MHAKKLGLSTMLGYKLYKPGRMKYE